MWSPYALSVAIGWIHLQARSASMVGLAGCTSLGVDRGSLAPLERLEALCDQGSLELIRSGIVSLGSGATAQRGDGVVAGFGRVEERPIACLAQDAGVLGGSLGVAHADSITRVLQLASRQRVPVVSFIESGAG